MVDVEELESVTAEADRRARETGAEALPDGVLDLALYEQAPVKIMWILKQDREDCQDGATYAERIRRAAKEQRVQSSPTWASIAYASYAILNGVEKFESIPDANECSKAMLSTALVEIQKELGDPTTSDQIVRDGYAKYGDLLSRQIKAADPDVIIVCLPEGLKDVVLSIRKDVFSLDDDGWSWGSCASSLCGRKLLLWAWHPSQRCILRKEYVETIYERWAEFRSRGNAGECAMCDLIK